MENFIKILKEDTNSAYDYISNNYYRMDKGELGDIIKELLFAVYTYSIRDDGLAEYRILNDVLTNLTDIYE